MENRFLLSSGWRWCSTCPSFFFLEAQGDGVSSLPGVLSEPLLLLLAAAERGAAPPVRPSIHPSVCSSCCSGSFSSLCSLFSALQPSARVSQSSGELSVPRLRLHLPGSCSPPPSSHPPLLPTCVCVCVCVRCGGDLSPSLQGLNQVMRQHESTSAAEHLRMMAKRNSTLESKVTMATGRPTGESPCACG